MITSSPAARRTLRVTLPLDSLQLRVSAIVSAGALMFLPTRAWIVATIGLYLRRNSCEGLPCSAADSAFSAELAKKNQAAKDNAWHWSVYAKRKLFENVSLTAQVASDHLRHFNIVFATPSATPATLRTKDWYYVMRVEFGI